MNLYLVRHGLALSLAVQGITVDAKRVLSAKGEIRTKSVARALKRLKCVPEIICTSPFVRASQTAVILAKRLTPGRGVKKCACLAPNAGVADGLDFIKHLDQGTVMLVGHMPHLSRLASGILFGNEKTLALDFDKSGVCLITWEGKLRRNSARLQWMLNAPICGHICK